MVDVAEQIGRQRTVAFLHFPEPGRCRIEPRRRIGDVGVQRCRHHQHVVAVGAGLLLGTHRHRDLCDQRLFGQFLVVEQPAPHSTGEIVTTPRRR